jgi:hypothetical protein
LGHNTSDCKQPKPVGVPCSTCNARSHVDEDCGFNKNKDDWTVFNALSARAANRAMLANRTMIAQEQGETDDADSNFFALPIPDRDSSHMGEALLASPLLMPFQPRDILLDNGSSVHVFKCEDCVDVQPLATPRRIGGVSQDAAPLIAYHSGWFAPLQQRVLVSDDTAVSLLSYARLIDQKLDLSYDKLGDSFSVPSTTHPGTALIFRRRVKPDGTLHMHYAYNPHEVELQRNFVATVSQNLQQYTVRDRKNAYAARKLQETLGCGVQSLMEVVRAGILGSPVTCAHVQAAEAIFGPSIPGLKAHTSKHASTIPVQGTGELAPEGAAIPLLVEVDVIFIKGVAFVLGLALPLGLAMIEHIRDRSTALVAKALNRMISALKSRNFVVQQVLSDNEGAVAELIPKLGAAGIVVDRCGPGQHVPGIERLARTVKERVRAYDTTLPFVMCAKLLVMCAICAVTMINWVPNSQSLDRTSASERFAGRKLNAKIDLKGQFGEYFQCTVPNTDNTMTARTQGCIYGYPTGNLTGTAAMFQLSTGQRVMRDQMTPLPMPEEVAEHLTRLATAEGFARGTDPGVPAITQHSAWPDFPLADMVPPGGGAIVLPDDEEDHHSDLAPDNAEDPAIIGGGEDHGIGEEAAGATDDTEQHLVALNPQPALATTQAHEPALGSPASYPATQDPPQAPRHYPAASRRGGRTATDSLQSLGSRALLTSEQARQDPLLHELWRRRHWHDMDFAFHISVRAAMKARPAETEPAMEKELRQMIDKNVWHPVRFERLTPAQRRATLRSSMFMKLKYLASGLFDKLKARLVAGGDQQDKSLYENLSAPTAATSSVFTVAAIAASEGRLVATMDIGGAFLNAKMDPSGVLVHMRLDKLMTSLLTKLEPEYAPYVASDGTMVVQLDKALYGTVEAAALWHADLTTRLKAEGFVENPYDPCVYNKTCGDGVQTTIVIHVDDLLVTSANQAHIDALHSNLKEAYPAGADGTGGITYKTGQVLDYVGLTLDFRTAGEVAITMVNAINEILETCGVETTSATPAASCLFDVREGVELASADMAKWFHSNVAKVLHVSKRVLPECLTSVSFLSTRVQACDIDDLAKLRRLLGYIRANRTRGVILRVGQHMGVKSFIDAAYGVHTSSGRSHTGCAIVLGAAGPVYVKSGKQKIVTKSSTEAELVAMSDCTSQAIHLRNFVAAQGYDMGPAIIYQDNMSTMALMKRGGPCSERSRHIDIRHFWVAERVANHEVRIEHLGTAEMFSNVLTKPVQGAQFLRERLGLTNWP